MITQILVLQFGYRVLQNAFRLINKSSRNMFCYEFQSLILNQFPCVFHFQTKQISSSDDCVKKEAIRTHRKVANAYYMESFQRTRSRLNFRWFGVRLDVGLVFFLYLSKHFQIIYSSWNRAIIWHDLILPDTILVYFFQILRVHVDVD